MTLFDHLVGPSEQQNRKFYPERFRSLKVQNEVELVGLLNRQVLWTGTPQYPIDVISAATVERIEVGSVCYEATAPGKVSRLGSKWQFQFVGYAGDCCNMRLQERIVYQCYKRRIFCS